jgi:hypothetical protein
VQGLQVFWLHGLVVQPYRLLVAVALLCLANSGASTGSGSLEELLIDPSWASFHRRCAAQQSRMHCNVGVHLLLTLCTMVRWPMVCVAAVVTTWWTWSASCCSVGCNTWLEVRAGGVVPRLFVRWPHSSVGRVTEIFTTLSSAPWTGGESKRGVISNQVGRNESSKQGCVVCLAVLISWGQQGRWQLLAPHLDRRCGS